MNIKKPMIISSIVNTLLSLIKIIFGFIGNCSSLIADGMHSLSDLLTDLIAIFGNYLSLKPADSKHPFGHGKIEYITSMLIGLVILIISFSLIFNVFNKDYTVPNILTVFVTILTITVKYILAKYLYDIGTLYQNNILIASSRESKADVYSSVFVLFSILLMQLSSKYSILKYTDLIATIIIALFIMKTGYLILKDNINILLEEQIDDNEYLKKVKKIILSYDEIVKIEDLYVLRYGPYYKLISNVVMEDTSLSLAHDTITDLEMALKIFDNKIKYVFIHMESVDKKK